MKKGRIWPLLLWYACFDIVNGMYVHGYSKEQHGCKSKTNATESEDESLIQLKGTPGRVSAFCCKFFEGTGA